MRHGLAPRPNLYYNNAYLKTIYMRTAPGQNGYTTPGYPSSPSGGYYPWGGAWGVMPGVLFQVGQLEGVVNPYGASSPTPTPTPSSSVLLNAGGPSYTATDGPYTADQYFSGGSSFSTTNPIANTADDTLYQTERWGSGSSLSYNIPLTNGTYDLTLKFAEIYFTSAVRRVFDVLVEGTERIANLDVFQAAGGANTAYDTTLPVTVTDGTLNILFRADISNTKVSAIKVVPAANPTPTPTASPTACSQYTPSSTIPTDDASPYDVVSSPSTNLMNATCDVSSARIDLGKGDPLQYIYNQGYLFKTGGTSWSPVPYTSTESLITGAWYPKTANTTLSLTSTELTSPSYSLAYICSWTGSAWKCGCRDQACTQSYWQIQSFKR